MLSQVTEAPQGPASGIRKPPCFHVQLADGRLRGVASAGDYESLCAVAAIAGAARVALDSE